MAVCETQFSICISFGCARSNRVHVVSLFFFPPSSLSVLLTPRIFISLRFLTDLISIDSGSTDKTKWWIHRRID